MFDELRRRPATLLAHARRLAKLQQQLAAIAAPDWMIAPGWTPDPDGDAVLHLDLHPMNVVLSPDGPVVIDWTNAAAGPAGFDASITYVVMAAFTPDELDVLLNGSREKWEVHTIVEYLKFDHGYTRNSRAVRFLLEVLCEFDDATLAVFLKFVTGSPRLPVGGLARLTPRLTIVQKRPEDDVSPDAYLPSVMTCRTRSGCWWASTRA